MHVHLTTSDNGSGNTHLHNTPNISDKGALLVLSLENNNLKAAGGKALAEGLKGNQVITELNISNNELGYNSNYNADTSGAVALADAIADMGAMSQFTFSGDSHNPVTMEISMTKADFSAKGLGKSGAIMVAAFLPKCT
jgi:hypothetical protein